MAKLTIGLRVSKIVNFNEGVRANKADFLTLLGWAMAEPDGNTWKCA